VTSGDPAATLAAGVDSLPDLRALQGATAVGGKHVAQQRPIVASHPGAFELDPESPQGEAGEDGETPRDRLSRQLSYARVDRLPPSLALTAGFEATLVLTAAIHVRLVKATSNVVHFLRAWRDVVQLSTFHPLALLVY
jgi:hypothetical protein